MISCHFGTCHWQVLLDRARTPIKPTIGLSLMLCFVAFLVTFQLNSWSGNNAIKMLLEYLQSSSYCKGDLTFLQYTFLLYYPQKPRVERRRLW
ncbi:hypothetical protein JB92DRAFT_914754 [Gautieria morchelliformis]|nr:hypothetical protein JB92DRAFT_914754 [Gautieria morchelliformis]